MLKLRKKKLNSTIDFIYHLNIHIKNLKEKTFQIVKIIEINLVNYPKKIRIRDSLSRKLHKHQCQDILNDIFKIKLRKKKKMFIGYMTFQDLL